MGSRYLYIRLTPTQNGSPSTKYAIFDTNATVAVMYSATSKVVQLEGNEDRHFIRITGFHIERGQSAAGIA